ncbi:glycosyltransferase family 4 protein [Polluticaenibacter yanchengensis]|uniref:Glycosyltransferase family 1 protein n=1 Tax=Polluticaenibacter yanchengensis TaxID=3014562 RepID=A0ABT4UP66_9BACT|nr:glycosyltransferase family 1 protein [Chitinophagaceae bacterium LY-5]
MNIGFDAKRAFHNKTGLGNYSRALITALDEFYTTNNYILYSKKTTNQAYNKWYQQLNHARLVSPASKKLSSLWRTFSIPRLLAAHNCDIYHGLSAELPFGKKPANTKYIVTIHDLIFLRLPHLFPFIDRKIYYQKNISACKKADRIIAISEQTKADLINFLKVPAEKIDVVYQTCDTIFEQKWHEQDKQALKIKYDLPDTYILNVGTLEERKNALIILKALTQLPEKIQAVFIGKQTAYQATLNEYIEKHHLQQRVKFLSNIPFAELPGLYQLASVFVYPSTFEGFGIPVLEALKCGTPTIAATGSCLEEAGGEGAIYFHPNNSEALKDAIEKILHDPAFTAQIIHKGYEHAALFSNQAFADKTIEVYQRVIKKD